AGAEVHHLTDRLGVAAHEQEAAHGIGHKGEVTALLTAPIDDQILAFERQFDELWYDVIDVPWSVTVERPNDGDRHLPRVVIRAGQPVRSDLGRRVRRRRLERVALIDGAIVQRRPVHLRGTRDDDALELW